LTLLKAVGHGVEVHEIVLPKMLDALHEMEQRNEQEEQKILRVR